ncbi:MAG: hypothetical protein E7515_00520 [Ruminococcaceae bacterium]|nr:hypothetical protein [Oscillospiraceae bacterium]
MNKATTDTMKAIGAGMAIGGAAAAITNAVTGSSMKRTLKKTVKKAGSALTDMMNNAQSMMK